MGLPLWLRPPEPRPAPRRLVTAAGDVTLRRRYFTCRCCGACPPPGRPARRRRPGQSPRPAAALPARGRAIRSSSPPGCSARSPACASATTPCARSATITAAGCGPGNARTPRRPGRSARPHGDVEFQTDGTCVNTTGGWREVRLSIFARRPRGKPVTDLDALGRPAAADADGPRGHRGDPHQRGVGARSGGGPRARLGTAARPADLTVLADGAKWIWKEVEKNLPGASGVLDIYHASEHLHAAAVALRGGSAPAAEAGTTARRRTLLESGAAGLLADVAAGGRRLPELAAYLEPARRPHAVPRASGRGPLDRQRPGRGCVQDGDRPAPEADRGPLADPPPGAHGGPVLPDLQRPVRRLLGNRPPDSDQIPLPHPTPLRVWFLS